MNYAELAVMQTSRAKTFSAAQTDAMAAYCQAEHDLKELQAENAKLRELLLDVHALGCSGFDCTECPIAFAERCNDEYSGCEWVSILTDRMREMGIEMDDA